MDIAYFYMTQKGARLVESLELVYPGQVFDKSNYKTAVAQLWNQKEALVFVMASGIVVRTIAPYIRSKTSDPAVIVMDQEGKFVISLLSGHLGGANEVAQKLAAVTGGQAVITTATDVEKVPAMDVFAKKNHLKIENIHQLKYISGAMVDKNPVLVISQWPVTGKFPAHVRVIERPAQVMGQAAERETVAQAAEVTENNIVVIGMPSFCKKTAKAYPDRHVLMLSKRPYVIGTGCKRAMDAKSYQAAFETFIGQQGIAEEDICAFSTIDLKKDEKCILTLAKSLDADVRIFAKETIEEIDLSDVSGKCIETSDFVRQITGVGSVSEVCAWLGSGKGEIIAGKTKFKGITFALAKEEEALRL